MELEKIVEIVQLKSKQALDSHLVGNSTAAVEALQEIATIISSEFGATDEVAVASPEGDEKSEEVKTVDLPAIYVQVHEHVQEAEVAFAAGAPKLGREHLAEAMGLLNKIMATESG